MKMYVFNLKSVKKGKNINWLDFTSTIGFADANKNYTIEFCGTELIIPDLYLEDDITEELKELLKKDYGYPPYEIKKCKEILKRKNSYSIKID